MIGEFRGLRLVRLGQHRLVGDRRLVHEGHGLPVVVLEAVPGVDQQEDALELPRAPADSRG